MSVDSVSTNNDYVSTNNTPVCDNRESIPLIVDENNKSLCECEAMVGRITMIVKGEALPYSETEDVRCLMDAVKRNRATIYRVANAIKSVLDALEC